MLVGADYRLPAHERGRHANMPGHKLSTILNQNVNYRFHKYPISNTDGPIS